MEILKKKQQKEHWDPTGEGVMDAGIPWLTLSPLPSALHALWRHHRLFEAFEHRGQGLGHVEKMVQRLLWCWGQRGAGSSPEPSLAHYEGLDGQQNLKVEFKH